MAPANGARKKASWAEALADSLEFNLQNVHISYDHTPAGGEGVVLSVLLKSFSAKSDETLAEDTAGNKTLKLEGTLQACDLLPPSHLRLPAAAHRSPCVDAQCPAAALSHSTRA